ncbi:ion channel [Phenylobacterium sp. LH3H17]|uniref:potassium channel family protein n=1 Tax=Phenylobacterium sp. LH3H17 TaxID=2903901 RepID=UPI0020C9FC04|nr:potassium channel family protein [Phenylobacterium sp. LH3H17]UTP37859.1 ion channel [Phenylobacterium sp. LH3H17]
MTNDSAAAPPPKRRIAPRVRARLHELYHGHSRKAVRFRLAVIAIDFLLIAFFIVAPFIRESPAFLIVDIGVALILAIDIGARGLAAERWTKWLRSPSTLLDIFVLITLLFPLWLFNLAFLRVLRLWTLVHSEFFWETVGRRYDDTRWEDVTRAAVTLVTFVFVMTGFVYTSFARIHPGIDGYVDALYFTVATLTTTGFGDITLPGTWGRVISIVTMLTGITLFVRLAQALFRPYKVRFPCPACGLQRHDIDAVHCKACGELLNIPNDDFH